MESRRSHRKSTFAIVGVLALLATVLAAVPAVAAGHIPDCGDDVRITGNRAYVSPNGTNDTEAITCVLGWAADFDGRGTPTIHLAAGTFYSDFIGVSGFDGRIRGAGQDYTVIEPLEGGLECGPIFDQFGATAWWVFEDSHLAMSHLAFSIPEVACNEPYIDFVDVDPETGDEFAVKIQDFTFMVINLPRSPQPTDVCDLVGPGSVRMHHVSVDAPTPDFRDPTGFYAAGAQHFLRVGGANSPGCSDYDEMVGPVFLSHIHAKGVGRVIGVESMADSLVTLRRIHTEEVELPIVIANSENTTVRVYNNHFESVFGPGVIVDNCSFPPFGEEPVCLAEPMKVNIHHNTMQLEDTGFAGVGFFDGFFAPPQIEAQIADNDITLNGALAGVFLEDADGVRVVRNDIDGFGVFGVLVEGASTGNTIMRNDFRDLFAFEAAGLLAPPTSFNHWLGNLGGEVIDLGTDNVVSHRSGPPPRLGALSSLLGVTSLEGLSSLTEAPFVEWEIDRSSYSRYGSAQR